MFSASARPRADRARLRIIGDRGQRLVELVRERGRQRSHLADRGPHGPAPTASPAAAVRVSCRCCQVADEAGEHPLALRSRPRRPKLDREGVAVAVASRRDPADADDLALAGFAVVAEIAVMPLAVGRRHQHGDILADHLVFRIAEHLFGRGAEREDGAHFVDDDHRVGHGREDRPQVLFASCRNPRVSDGWFIHHKRNYSYRRDGASERWLSEREARRPPRPRAGPSPQVECTAIQP